MALSPLGQLIRAVAPEKQAGDVTISYSQFSMFSKCPHQWKLNYAMKLRTFKPGIHAIFGTALHETLQYYLQQLYSTSAHRANQIDLTECLQEQLQQNYLMAVADNNGDHFSTPTELGEFYSDGIEILRFIKSHQSDYFSTRDYELVGIEMPLLLPATDKHPIVKINGFIDIVLKEKSTGRIVIIDIKTSTSGWSDSVKKDKTKIAQLLLYKHYFSLQYNIPVDDIDVEFFVVKRKLKDYIEFAQKRVQVIRPASGRISRKKTIDELEKFITTCFNVDGTYNLEADYPAVAGAKGSNCKFCEYVADFDKCPAANRKTE